MKNSDAGNPATSSGPGLGPVERFTAAPGTDSKRSTQTVRPDPASPWLGTPSGIIALTALVLSIVLIPLFFPLAGLAFVLAVIALVRRRPRPRSAWVVAVISGVLLVVVLAVGILATVLVFSTEESSSPGVPQPATSSVSVPVEAP